MSGRPFVHFKKVLRDTGLPWEIVNGPRHKKLYLAGRYVGTIPVANQRDVGHARRNVEMQIRRVLEEVTGCAS